MNKMDSAFRIKETLYIETSKNKVVPLIPAGRRIPTDWKQTFTTYKENQRSFDLHFLRGMSDIAMENITLGKWRIAGIPPAPKGEHRVRVNIRLGADGSVGLDATLKKQPLPVTFLTETLSKIPLTIKVPNSQLEKLVQKPCWSCKSNFVIGTTNWKNEPFALCLDCGNEFAIPETLNTSVTAPWEELPPELLNTLGIKLPHKPGGLPLEELQELRDKGFNLNPEEQPDLDINANKVFQQIPGMIFGQKTTKADLDHEEILRLAGEPLPESERRKCPKCDAVISRDSKRCEWCGQTL